MTRKRWRKLMVALAVKVQANAGAHVTGEILSWYRDKDITTIKAKSYAEAWEMMKPVREVVGM